MVEFLSRLIGNDRLATAIISIIPLIELKGGIVFARGAGLGVFQSFLFAYLGSCLAFFPAFFLFTPILNLLKKIKFFRGFAERCENYFKLKAQKAEKKGAGKSEKFYKTLGVFLFVAIPLPMTGVWTGTVIALFLGLKFKDAVLPVFLGNFAAGAIISLLAESVVLLFGDLAVLDYLLYGLLALAALSLVIVIIRLSRTKKERGDQCFSERKKER